MAVQTRTDVAVLTTIEDIDALEGEWHELEARSSGLTAFSTWEWSRSIASHYWEKRPIRLFTFRRGGMLIGIAPFGETRMLGLRVLRPLCAGFRRYSLADYTDVLMADGYEDEVLAAFCDALASQPWDVLRMQELPWNSSTGTLLADLASQHGWTATLSPSSDVHPLPLEGTWESYRATLSRGTRNDTGRLTRKLIAERGASFVRIDGDEKSVEQGMETLFQLHTRRWAEAGGPGIFRDARRCRFHHDVARRFARRGRLFLTILHASDEPVAAEYGFEVSGVQYHYAAGVRQDGDWRRFSLGTVLDLHVIEDAFGRSLRCVDFMRGVGYYKDHYRSESHFNQELLVFRNSRARLHYRVADQVARKMDGVRRRLEWKRQRILGTE